MVDDGTQGAKAAGSGARVSAFLADAGLVAGAIGVDRALGAAVGRRSDVIGRACARRVASLVLARGERAAGRRDAGVRLLRWCGHHCGIKARCDSPPWVSRFRGLLPHLPL